MKSESEWQASYEGRSAIMSLEFNGVAYKPVRQPRVVVHVLTDEECAAELADLCDWHEFMADMEWDKRGAW